MPHSKSHPFFRVFPVLASVLLLVLFSASGAEAAKKKVEAEPVVDSAAAARQAFMKTQEYAAQKFIYTLLGGDVDSLKVLFDEKLQPKVTKEVVEYFQGQFKWFYDMVGGEFEQFMEGRRDSAAYFREYRIANEINKAYPLILVQALFPDSLSTTLIGAQVKNFLGNDKPISGEHVWQVGDRTYNVHSIKLVPVDSGSIMAIQYFDDDTTTLTQEVVSRNGIPLIREAVARGFLDSARAVAVTEGAQLKNDIGVVFIRRDPQRGLQHIKVGFLPEDWEMPGDKKATKTKATPVKSKAAPAKKSTKKK